MHLVCPKDLVSSRNEIIKIVRSLLAYYVGALLSLKPVVSLVAARSRQQFGLHNNSLYWQSMPQLLPD